MRLTKEEAEKKYPGAMFYGDVFNIEEGAVIRDGVVIGKGADIREGAVIRDGVVIGKGAVIGRRRKTVRHCIVIHGIGNTKTITGFLCDDGPIVTIGCANYWRGLPPDEMRLEVATKYPPDHIYFAAIDLIERFLKEGEK